MNVSGEPPSIADAASWAVATAVTKTAREQLAYLLEQRDVVERIFQRFGNLELPQRQGHVFEWMHELTYNLDAIAKDDAARLRVTTWLGQPHDPADLRLVGPSGEVLREAQAKVIERTAARLSAQHGVSSDKYVGMDLLVPGDHLGDARDLIGRRLAMPEGLLHDRYRDVGDRLSDKVSHGGVSSQPVASGG